MDETEGNPTDTARPDSVPPPEPPKPSLDEPEPEPPTEERLSKQVPLGLLFFAAAFAVLLFLALVGVGAYFALSPSR